MGKDVGKDVDEFDIEGWISSARLPERSVTLYARGDLLAEHQAVEEALRAHKASDARLGSDGGRSDLAQRVRDLEEQIRDSKRVFRVRALTAAEQDKVRTESVKDDEGNLEFEDYSALWLSVSTVEPKVTPSQVKALRARLGEGQFAEWFAASTKATNEKVTVPFSLAASGSLSPSRS